MVGYMDDLSLVKQRFISYVDKLVENNKISHTYLIEIGNYDDDYKFVIDFVKMILCNLRYDELVSSKNSLIHLIDTNNFPDIKVVEPEGSYIKKSQLLDLQKEFNNKSLYDTKRVYIIKNAEKLNSASANTILKFLEEPENDIIALLLTDNRYHVIDTIISRCQILTLKEDIFVFDDNEDIINLLECIIKPREFFIRYNYFINNVILDKDSAFNKFSTIENLLTQYLNHYYCKNEINNDISNILDKVDKNRILNTISILEDSLEKLEFNVNYKLWIDSLISRLVLGG